MVPRRKAVTRESRYKHLSLGFKGSSSIKQLSPEYSSPIETYPTPQLRALLAENLMLVCFEKRNPRSRTITPILASWLSSTCPLSWVAIQTVFATEVLTSLGGRRPTAQFVSAIEVLTSLGGQCPAAQFVFTTEVHTSLKGRHLAAQFISATKVLILLGG